MVLPFNQRIVFVVCVLHRSIRLRKVRAQVRHRRERRRKARLEALERRHRKERHRKARPEALERRHRRERRRRARPEALERHPRRERRRRARPEALERHHRRERRHRDRLAPAVCTSLLNSRWSQQPVPLLALREAVRLGDMVLPSRTLRPIRGCLLLSRM